MSQELDVLPSKSSSMVVMEDLQAAIPFSEIIKDLREMREAKLANGQRDWRAVEIADKLWLSYVIGEPVKRILRQTQDIPSPPPLEELAATPAGIEALARMLARVPGGREAFSAAAGA